MEKEKKEEHCQKWKLKIITKNIFTNKSKSTDKNQHFFCPMTKQTQKRIHTKKLWKQFVSSRQNINMHNPKLLPNLKQPLTLASFNYQN